MSLCYCVRTLKGVFKNKFLSQELLLHNFSYRIGYKVLYSIKHIESKNRFLLMVNGNWVVT